ncbi:MAG: peptide-methionine (S)-S-oxide reductase, partial [Aeromonas salmonicida]
DSKFTPAPEMDNWAQRHPWRFGFYARRCGGWPLVLSPEL